MTVLELVELKKKIEEEWGITAAAPVAVAAAARPRRGGGDGGRGADGVRRRAHRRRRQEDPGDQGRPRDHGPRPQGGEGPRRRRPQRRQGGREPRKRPTRSRRSSRRPAPASRSSSAQARVPAPAGPGTALASGKRGQPRSSLETFGLGDSHLAHRRRSWRLATLGYAWRTWRSFPSQGPFALAQRQLASLSCRVRARFRTPASPAPADISKGGCIT